MNTYSHAVSSLTRSDMLSQPVIVRRGNLSVLATAEFRDGQMVSTPVNKQRYVWPNPYNHTNSGIMSRKFFAR